MDTPDFTPTTLNLTQAASHVVRAQEAHQGRASAKTAAWLDDVLALWADLTGLSGPDALTYAYQVHRHPGADITAAVAPF